MGKAAADKTNESVSMALEFAMDDYCIDQMPKGFGQLADYIGLMIRSLNDVNLFNKETGFSCT